MSTITGEDRMSHGNNQKTPLQKLLSLRDLSVSQIANATGLGYHAIQKTIKQQRCRPETRQAIAQFLGLPYDHLWGDCANEHLNRLIRQEIEKHTACHQQSLRATYLPEDN